MEALQLGTRRRLAGHFAGEHRSVRHGSSIDFADYRQYNPGDDFRRIDYFLYARLGVLNVKLFEAEEDLHLRLLIDTSASMAAGDKLAVRPAGGGGPGLRRPGPGATRSACTRSPWSARCSASPAGVRWPSPCSPTWSGSRPAARPSSPPRWRRCWPGPAPWA